ncbi:hypothetical protein H8E88_16470 [candidate division KSB1 bacterium]|nr:hypothetical protein [candidate division KSB1 bacterium]MBL7093968.1 hypothetical protein [candidate division KSB1 bacterium]
MSKTIVEKVGDVKIYGTGLLGGKGEGLVKINECYIPGAHKLRTRVLTTEFYDHYLNNGGQFGNEELETISSILEKLENIPISVRSSATNEACLTPDSPGSVHAGENTSFMLPNNHPEFSVRLQQLIQSIYFIYKDFTQNQPINGNEKMAIVINPIPGIYDETLAGSVYYPLISGVANSFFPYALKAQNPKDGFARIAFGHGYSTVIDDFEVISMATIKEPIPFNLLGDGQMYFYAINLSKNDSLVGHELETMKKLHARFSTSNFINLLGKNKERISFEKLIKENRFGFKSGLLEIMDTIAKNISAHFQIEFVFNVEKNNGDDVGRFHVVQLTQLPEQKFEKIQIPDQAKHTYLSVKNIQGHGIKNNLRQVIVVSPFIYTKEKHDSVRSKIAAMNRELKEKNEDYILIVPGRLGSNNREWGIQLEFREVDRAAAIFEYGVDVAGRAEPIKDENTLTGGIYGSHFLYMLQGGDDEEQKRLQTRIYGTQGTHFLTNLVSNNVVYGFITPNEDLFDPWFFKAPNSSDAVYLLTFPEEVNIYADTNNQNCVVVAEY